MPLNRTRFAARVDGTPRILFSILEKPNGELIIPIKTAERYRDNSGPRLLEQRYSIHPSPDSADFTTIKQTINTDDGKTETAVVLTDAVKLRTGFSIMFVRRVGDLTPDRYKLRPQKRHERTYIVADIDGKIHTLFLGVFLGHPDTPFDVSDADCVVSAFPFQKFKIILLATSKLIPSHYTTEYAHAVTLPPELTADPNLQSMLRHQMRGKAPAICVQQFRNTVAMLEKMIWQKALVEVTEPPELVAYINERIQAVEDQISLIRATTDTSPQSIHMLSDGKSPNPQLPGQPPQFVRRKGRWED